MKKKAIITTALVLAIALIGSIWWYTSQPAQVEEPAEPEGGEIAVNSEPQQDTPEPEADSEPEKDTPENEGDGDAAPPINEQLGFDNMTPEEIEEYIAEQERQMAEDANKTVEEILAEAGLLEEPAEDDGTSEVVEGQGQGQGQQQGQTGQQQQGQGQSGGQQTGGKTPEQIADELRKIAEAAGAVTGDVPHQDINPNIQGGGAINWG